MITLDASVVIAVLADSDPHHGPARAILGRHGRSLIHTMTLAQVLVGGERIGRQPQMADRIRELGVDETRHDADEATRLARLRVATGLKLPDCCVLLCAEDSRTGVATFDARLARAAQARGIEVLGAAG